MERAEERWLDGCAVLAESHTRQELEVHAAEGRQLLAELRARAEVLSLALRDVENGIEFVSAPLAPG